MNWPSSCPPTQSYSILLALLRAVVAPALLMLTVVLSFGTALGIATLVFEALGFASADPSLPLYAFVFFVALGVDYNIFLVTRIRQETHRHGTRAAARHALAATGGVITAAGLVLAATFSVLATLPLVGIAEIGIAVALGILIDTLIVRSVLVTGLALDLGDRFWWPTRPRARAEARRPMTGDSADSEPDPATAHVAALARQVAPE